jgi:hypothetical protein
MTAQVVSLQLPNDLYDKLQFLSASKQKNPVDMEWRLNNFPISFDKSVYIKHPLEVTNIVFSGGLDATL